MVGGTVIEVLVMANRVYINCQDREYGGECAIFVERNGNSEQIRRGDCVWWQGRYALWTPWANEGKPWLQCGVDFDIQIPRIGYSGVPHPAQGLVDRAFADRT